METHKITRCEQLSKEILVGEHFTVDWVDSGMGIRRRAFFLRMVLTATSTTDKVIIVSHVSTANADARLRKTGTAKNRSYVS
jgi:hypothetical protein